MAQNSRAQTTPLSVAAISRRLVMPVSNREDFVIMHRELLSFSAGRTLQHNIWGWQSPKQKIKYLFTLRVLRVSG